MILLPPPPGHDCEVCNEIFDQLRDIPNRLGWGDQATAG
jgi:hypothetical protein